MALIVQKYGGTSVGTTERIEAVAERVKRWYDEGHDLVVVLSAMSGETNRLIGLAKAISPEPEPRELDMMVSTGEQVTIALLAMALMKRGVPARSYTGAQVAIKTDSSFNKARIEAIDDARMRADLDSLFGWGGSSRAIRSPGGSTFPPINVGQSPQAVDVYVFAPGIDAARNGDEQIVLEAERRRLGRATRDTGGADGLAGVVAYANQYALHSADTTVLATRKSLLQTIDRIAKDATAP